MKHGIAKSLTQEVLCVVTETIADAYALMLSFSPSIVRKDDLLRDVNYVTQRLNSEGLSFLTVQLPALGDWFDRWIRGEAGLERVVGFTPYDGLYPCFLRPFWVCLQPLRGCFLNPDDDGSIEPDMYKLVRLLRTILHGLKKLNVPSTDEQIADKLESFLSIERELRCYPIVPSPVLWRAQLLLDDYMDGYNPSRCLHPRHGPGAVSGGERGNQKWNFSTLYASLHAEYPYYDYHFGTRSLVYDKFARQAKSRPIQLAALAKQYLRMKKSAYPVARLLFVPKDSRGPRIISCEPKELMYVQQGVARDLMVYIESHPYTKGHVNFTEQSINANLALEASASRKWATIDLSDASDRVGCDLIRHLFRSEIVKKWFALRSTATQLPNGFHLPLRKFAPMGSALCFPVESLVFWSLAVACVWEHTGDLALALDSVYVYGDDIVVRDEYYRIVVGALESVHLKVNRSKSFHGDDPFRESCGIDALNGFDVTPLRIRNFPASRPSDGQAIAAWVKYAENSVYLAPRRSEQLLRSVEKLVGRIPRVAFPQPFLSIVHPEQAWDITQYPSPVWDPAACYYTSKLIVLKARKTRSEFDSWWKLQSQLISWSEADPSLVVARSATQIRKRQCFITYLERGIEV